LTPPAVGADLRAALVASWSLNGEREKRESKGRGQIMMNYELGSSSPLGRIERRHGGQPSRANQNSRQPIQTNKEEINHPVDCSRSPIFSSTPSFQPFLLRPPFHPRAPPLTHTHEQKINARLLHQMKIRQHNYRSSNTLIILFVRSNSPAYGGLCLQWTYGRFAWYGPWLIFRLMGLVKITRCGV
jgi:hypothetical protein